MSPEYATDQDLDEDVLVWLRRLKAAYEAGYYRTESAVEEQTPIPWRRITCRDCSSWTAGFCDVYATWRDASHDICPYFDAMNRRNRLMAKEKEPATALSGGSSGGLDIDRGRVSNDASGEAPMTALVVLLMVLIPAMLAGLVIVTVAVPTR